MGALASMALGQKLFCLPESKRTIRECGAAEQANFGISAYGWSLWLRDCVHGVEDELCGALFALKLSSLLASSVLHTASHSARNASQAVATSMKGATGAQTGSRKVGGSAVKRESPGADIRAKRLNCETRAHSFNPCYCWSVSHLPVEPRSGSWSSPTLCT